MLELRLFYEWSFYLFRSFFDKGVNWSTELCRITYAAYRYGITVCVTVLTYASSTNFEILYLSYLKDFVVTFIKVFRFQLTPIQQTKYIKNISKFSKSKKSRYGGFIFLYDSNVKSKPSASLRFMTVFDQDGILITSRHSLPHLVGTPR